jgi:uncharacterized protein (DUF1015 family)
MAKIIPFQALRYNTDKVRLKHVVCPPYDVINRSQRKACIKQSPYNIVRIVLPDRKADKPDYKKAGQDLLRWTEKEILRHDNTKSFYVYVQETVIDKERISRCGFLSLLRLETAKNKCVLPHENVFSKPLNDRVRLMTNTKAHLSPIFIVFDDKKKKAQSILSDITSKKAPDLDIYADKARHRLWPVTDKNTIKALSDCLDQSQTFIADGHHRYKASIKTRDHFRKKKLKTQGHEYTLVYLVGSQDKGLKILPTYRAVKILPKGFDFDYIEESIKDYFDIKYISSAKAAGVLETAFKNRECVFVLYYKKRYMCIKLKNKESINHIGPKDASIAWKGLDVSILHNLVLDKLLRVKENTGRHRNIYYYKDRKELIDQIDAGRQHLGILLNPSTMDDVNTLAMQDEKMPHKSTYFFPKPLTGLVIHKF